MQLLDYFLAHQEEMIQMLGDLVMLESPSSEREAVNAVADYLTEAFAAQGAQVERLPQTAFGDHLRVEWGGGEDQVLLVGHMDTVWPLGEVETRPFQISADGKRATGPGVFDMKNGLVIGLYVVRAFRELGLEPTHRLVFLFNSDEEVGSLTSRPFIEKEARRSKAALILEPSRDGALVTWRKGVGRFEMEIHGLASHSGAAHGQGISAVEELAHQILRLEAMTDYKRGTTVNVGVVGGGSKVNVRPATAWAEIDLRVTNAAEGERMVQAIRSLQPVNPKTTLIVTGGLNRPPWQESPAGRELFARAQRLGASLGLNLWASGSGGGSDGNFTAALGVPTLDGMGIEGDDAHATSEWADLTSLPRKAALLAALLLDLE